MDMSTTIYTPQDVFNFAENGDEDRFIIALNQRDNSTNWYRNALGDTACHLAAIMGYINIVEMILDRGFDVHDKNNDGWTILHYAAAGNQSNIMEMLLDRGFDIYDKNSYGATILHYASVRDHINIIEMLLERGFDFNSKTNGGRTALHYAAIFGRMNAVELLLQRGIDIDDDIDRYAPLEEDEDANGNIIIYTDCRPIIVTEIDNRRKRPIFDSFINHHIEYQPYINIIYTRCFPTGNVQVAKPPVGWTIAEAVRDKYYFDEIFFYLHMHVSNLYSITTNNIKSRVTRSSMKCSNSTDQLANNSNKTSTLMIVLTDRLKMYLKPNTL
jgi:hypothetical protein